MIRVLLLSWLCLGSSVALSAAGDADTEIRGLIQAVAESGCEFDRNGTRYSAKDAAQHLELKYSRGKRHVKSAEDFIQRLASKSSWSGNPYQMICEGETEPAGDWLSATLIQLRTS